MCFDELSHIFFWFLLSAVLFSWSHLTSTCNLHFGIRGEHVYNFCCLSVVLSSQYLTDIHRRTSHPSHQLECFRWKVSSLLEPLHAIVSWCLPFPYPQLSWVSIMLFGWRNPTTCSGLKISVSNVTRFFPQNSRNCSLSSHDNIYSVGLSIHKNYTHHTILASLERI